MNILAEAITNDDSLMRHTNPAMGKQIIPIAK
jgi:hypothetical protein